MMIAELTLTDAERKQILQQREHADRKRWLGEGIFLAADRLEQLGRESAGGDGEAVNPTTGLRWGESFFSCAQQLRQYGAQWYIKPDRPF